MLRKLQAQRSLPKHAAILDIGCGGGLFFDALAEFGEVEGVEPDASLADPHDPKTAKIFFQPFDSRFQPGKRYDLILMLDVLEHMSDPRGALEHAANLLEDHGTLALTLPAFLSFWTNHDELNYHYTRYTKRSLHVLAHSAGVTIEDDRYFFHWTCAAKLLVRLKEAVWRRDAKPESLPPAPINRMLYALSRLEQATIGRLPMPIGTSLLAIGRKASSSAPATSEKQTPAATLSNR